MSELFYGFLKCFISQDITEGKGRDGKGRAGVGARGYQRIFTKNLAVSFRYSLDFLSSLSRATSSLARLS